MTSSIRWGEEQLKFCRYCGISLPRSDFYKRKASPDGLGYKCKKCSSLHGKTQYQSNKQKAIDRAAKWVMENPERRREIARRYDAKIADEKREKWRISQQEKRKSDPDRCKLEGRIAAHKRRARMFNAQGNIGVGLADRLINKSGGICTYCGSQGKKITLDHFEPVSKGGSGQADNIVPCCKSCNSMKGTKDGADWIFGRFGIDGLVATYKRLIFLYSARLP